MDAGVIKNMKHLYRKEVLRKQIHALEHKIPFQINMKEVVMLIAHAWNLVQRETIQNCFRQSQIETRAEVEMVSEANDKATSGEDMIGLLKSHGVEEDSEEEVETTDFPKILIKTEALTHLNSLRDFVLNTVERPLVSEKVCEALTLLQLEIHEASVRGLSQKTITDYFKAAS